MLYSVTHSLAHSLIRMYKLSALASDERLIVEALMCPPGPGQRIDPWYPGECRCINELSHPRATFYLP